MHFNYQVGATNEYKIYYPMFGAMPMPQGMMPNPMQPPQMQNYASPIAYANADGTVGYMMPPPGFTGFVMPQPMM